MNRPSRWAIVGTGAVSAQFVAGLRSVDGASPALIVSRDLARAERFAATNGITSAVGAVGPEEVVEAFAPVDIVYIASPPSEHERHALAAIAAGKAVLVEKPFAIDAAAAVRIAEAAKAEGVFCMEAMWTRFLPLVIEARRLVESGALGELRSMSAEFHGADVPDAGQGIFDPAKGGGALLHRGVYGVSISHHLLGPVTSTSAMARFGTTGVDEDTAVVMRHASGAVSTSSSSLRTSASNGFSVRGTEARLDVLGPIYRPSVARLTPVTARRGGMGGDGSGTRLGALLQTGFAHTVRQRTGPIERALRGPRPRSVRARYSGNGYQYEAEAVCAAVTAGHTESSVMPLDETIEVMRILDAARSNWNDHEGTSG